MHSEYAWVCMKIMRYVSTFGAAVREGCTLDSLKEERQALVLELAEVMREEAGKGYEWPVAEAAALMAETISDLSVSDEEKLSLNRLYLRTIDEAHSLAIPDENGSQS